jgi:hypothetical protein
MEKQNELGFQELAASHPQKECGRVWESSSSAKITPELQIHEFSPWRSSTVNLEFQRVFGTAPDLPSSL